MVQDTISDLEVLSVFIDDLKDFTAEQDDKLNILKKLLTSDERLVNKKVLIFTEFRSTAVYIYDELEKMGLKNVFELDGQTKVDRGEIIRRFSPYYNDSTQSKDEINILIATDVLSEGLNLQDCSCLINYDIHWNPVRLMQRIGRVDRRRNAEVETILLSHHPELVRDRKYVYYWNFLPPEELENLLLLFRKVAKKTLRISKAFGIEGKKLLTPDDEYEALKEFNSSYEGKETQEEEMILEYEKLKKDIGDFNELMNSLPQRIYSGRYKSSINALFFCYRLPSKDNNGIWSYENGFCRWYLYDHTTGEIKENIYKIWEKVKCNSEELRFVLIKNEQFKEIKSKVDKYIRNSYLKPVQAPIGVKQKLLAWMELN